MIDRDMTVEEQQESRDYVLQQCRQQDVKFIRLWFTDILGSLKSFAITYEELEEAPHEVQQKIIEESAKHKEEELAATH